MLTIGNRIIILTNWVIHILARQETRENISDSCENLRGKSVSVLSRLSNQKTLKESKQSNVSEISLNKNLFKTPINWDFWSYAMVSVGVSLFCLNISFL